MLSIEFNMYATVFLAVIAVALGSFLQKRISFLSKFCIPAPVAGGLIISILTCILHVFHLAEITFDETLREFFMVFFFTSVGFQANVRVLKEGGKALIVFLILIIVLIILQNVTAISLSTILGMDRLLGLCTGSIPMVGGHGTAGAFGRVLEDFNVRGATTICTAAATFGLIAGSLLGGPLAIHLIRRYRLKPQEEKSGSADLLKNEFSGTLDHYPEGVFYLAAAAGIGTGVSSLLSRTGLVFPVYIGAMLTAALMCNLIHFTGKVQLPSAEISNFGNICLSLFLGIAMITLKIWQLRDLAFPLLFLLSGQVLLILLYTRLVIFNAMGRDYDAAVIAAGTCGFGMGATPNAMANMDAVTRRCGPSLKAYLLIPIVGSLFADFINSLVITFFINFL
ncbi:MAG: sodium/glutamate symporter [Solobacterium sp.]|nr:sodium/glutamate symporter [Solobacterium sp.]